MPAPTLSVSVDPPAPVLTGYTAPGTLVAKLIGTWSDGSPFTGSFIFVPPNMDHNGDFVIQGDNLVVNPAGPGITPTPNASFVDMVTIEAVQ